MGDKRCKSPLRSIILAALCLVSSSSTFLKKPSVAQQNSGSFCKGHLLPKWKEEQI